VNFLHYLDSPSLPSMELDMLKDNFMSMSPPVKSLLPDKDTKPSRFTLASESDQPSMRKFRGNDEN
jgi:hypothetical protein